MPLRLDQASENIGRYVVYHSPDIVPEVGVITEVRGDYVMVRYRGDSLSKATHPMMLDFVP